MSLLLRSPLNKATGSDLFLFNSYSSWYKVEEEAVKRVNMICCVCVIRIQHSSLGFIYMTRTKKVIIIQLVDTRVHHGVAIVYKQHFRRGKGRPASLASSKAKGGQRQGEKRKDPHA